MSVLGTIGAFAGGALNKFVDLGINMIGAKYANDLNMKNWYRQMEYNAPIAQLARLREAGLNPNLIYGSGGVQNTISGAPKMESPGSAPFDLMAYQQVKNGETQNELLQQQKRVAEAQEDNLQTRTAGEILKNVYQSLDNQYKNYENQHYFNTGTVKGGGIDRLIDRAVNMGEKYNPYLYNYYHKLACHFF